MGGWLQDGEHPGPVIVPAAQNNLHQGNLSGDESGHQENLSMGGSPLPGEAVPAKEGPFCGGDDGGHGFYHTTSVETAVPMPLFLYSARKWLLVSSNPSTLEVQSVRRVILDAGM